MATVTIDLEPGEVVDIQVSCEGLIDWEDGPDPGEEDEEEEDEYVEKTGTGERIAYIRGARAA